MQNTSLKYTSQYSFVPDSNEEVPRFEIGTDFITFYWHSPSLRDTYDTKQFKNYLSEKFSGHTELVQQHLDDESKTHYHGKNGQKLEAHHHIHLTDPAQYNNFVLEFVDNAEQFLGADKRDLAAVRSLLTPDFGVTVGELDSHEEENQRSCYRCSII